MIVLFLLGGCGGKEESTPAELLNLRVVGLWADHPEVSLEQVFTGQVSTVSVRSIDFHPGDLTDVRSPRSYEWTVCFSLGAFVRFECLDPSLALNVTTTVGQLDIPMDPESLFSLFPEALGDKLKDDEDSKAMTQALEAMTDGEKTASEVCPEGVGAACSDAMKCGDGLICDEGACAAFPALSPIPLAVRVRVRTEDGQERIAARSIGLRFAGEVNTNPGFSQFSLGMGTLDLPPVTDADYDCVQVGPFHQSIDEIPMSATVDENSMQIIKYLDGLECLEESEAERAFISWFTTGGRLENGSGTADYNENLLTLEKPSETTRVYIALRDGRNGLTMSCLEFDRTRVSQRE